MYSYMGCDCGQRTGMGFMPGPPHGNFLAGSDVPGISDGTYDAAIAAGWTDEEILELAAYGVTDSGIASMVASGQDPEAALAALAQATTPNASNPTNSYQPPAGTTAAPQGVSTAQSPPGSTLVYNVTWTAGLSNLLQSPNSVISRLQSQLPTYGLSIAASQQTSDGPINYGIQLTLHDTIGHALITDVQSVLHSLMISAVGNNLSGESISLTVKGGSATSTAVPGATSAAGITSWLEANGTTLALVGILGIVGYAVVQKL